MLELIASKIKAIAVALATLTAIIGGLFGGAEKSLPEGHILKCPQEKILLSREIDQIEFDMQTRQFINKGKAIRYLYKSDIPAPAQIFRGMEEDISKRTHISQTFKTGKTDEKGDEILVSKFVGESWFYQEPETKEWKWIKDATTTPNAWKKQVKEIGLLGGTAFADSMATTSWGYDISLNQGQEASWVATHDAIIADSGTPQATKGITWCDVNGVKTLYGIYRTYLPFDTSDLDDTASISAVTVDIYVETPLDNDNDAYAYIALVASTSDAYNGYALTVANPVSISTDDWEQLGATYQTKANIVSDKIDITNIGANAWETWTVSSTVANTRSNGGIIDEVNGITANDTSKGTLIAVREGHDIENVAIDHNDYSGIYNFRLADYAGTTSDPFITITYTIPSAPAAASDKYNIILFGW